MVNNLKKSIIQLLYNLLRKLGASSQSDGKYRLNVYNNGSENIDVRIFTQEGLLVHGQVLSVNGNYALIYNLKQLASPAFTFEVTTSNGNVKTVKF
jgi:hypothetical protein